MRTEEKTVWWHPYSWEIYGKERWSRANGTMCEKMGLSSDTNSKMRYVTGHIHSSMGSENSTPKMNLTMKSAGWISRLSFRWVPNVPWFHASLTKASQKNKACMLERHQMVTCLYCCFARTIQHLSKVKHLLKTRLLNTFCNSINCCNTAQSSMHRSTQNGRGKTILLTWPNPFLSVFFLFVSMGRAG